MENSNLTITVKAVGIPEAQAQLEKLGATMTKLTVNQNGTVSATGKLNTALDNQSKATDRVASATGRASKAQGSYFAHIAKTTVQSALINKLFLEFVDVTSQAVKQVDLINNFPQTMASMGQSTDSANKSLQVLRDYVGQVGGDLGDATSYVTRFTGAVGNVQAATAIFVGLSNALIAGDSSLEEQRGAMLQFAQALERGKIEAKEWNILTQNMSFQLNQVAESMGYVNSAALREAMVAGEESMASFTKALVEMSTGTGPIVSQAEARMNGMQFAFNRMKNTMVQGLSAIIDSIGRQNIVSFFTFLTQVIGVLTRAIITLIGWIVTLLNLLGALFGLPAIQLKKDTGGIAENIGAGSDNAGDLADGLGDAGKEAKKLNKSLASFDKMNVLPDKETGSDSGGSGGAGGAGAGFSGTDIGELGDITAGIANAFKDASKWAKIFAAILGALAANGLIKKLFGINPLKEFAKALFKYAVTPLLGFGKTAAITAARFSGTFGVALARGLLGLGSGGSGLMGTAAGLGAKIGLAVRGGMITGLSGLGTALRVAILSPLASLGRLMLVALAPIGAAIAGLAATLGLPIWVVVAIIIAVVAIIVGLIWLIWDNWQTIWGWITTAFSEAWNFISNTWNTLYDIFKGPVQFLWQFWSSVLILIVAILAIVLEAIFKLVVATVKLIYNVLAAIAGWINDNVIQPTWQFFQWLWNTITNAVIASWNFILNSVLKPVANWINQNVIQPIFNFFKSLWSTVINLVSGFVTGFYGTLKPIIGWLDVNVIRPIASLFSGLWGGVKTGLEAMWEAIRTIFGTLGGVIKSPINGVIDLINRALQNLNAKVKVPDWVPGLGGQGVNFPMIPKLAKGGIIDQATLAIVGESGTEAVMPLENNTEWIDTLASKLNERGGGGQPVQLIVQIGEDKVASKVIDLINEKTNMSGRNVIYV